MSTTRSPDCDFFISFPSEYHFRGLLGETADSKWGAVFSFELPNSFLLLRELLDRIAPGMRRGLQSARLLADNHLIPVEILITDD